jgi:hypothetical protein
MVDCSSITPARQSTVPSGANLERPLAVSDCENLSHNLDAVTGIGKPENLSGISSFENVLSLEQATPPVQKDGDRSNLICRKFLDLKFNSKFCGGKEIVGRFG